MEAEAQNTPCQRDRRCRACQEGSWEGGGSLVGVNDNVMPCGGHDASDDGKLHHCECNLPYFTLFGIIFTVGTPRLGIPASQWHGEVLPPCHCGARIMSMQYKCNALSAKGVNFGREGDQQICEEGRGVCHPSGSDFRSLRTSFGEKTRGTFFGFVQ